MLVTIDELRKVWWSLLPYPAIISFTWVDIVKVKLKEIVATVTVSIVNKLFTSVVIVGLRSKFYVLSGVQGFNTRNYPKVQKRFSGNRLVKMHIHMYSHLIPPLPKCLFNYIIFHASRDKKSYLDVSILGCCVIVCWGR